MRYFIRTAAFVAAYKFQLLRTFLFIACAISLFSEKKWLSAAILAVILVISVYEMFWPKVGPLFVAFISRKKEKLGTAGLAYAFDYCVNWLFNYPLYIWVMKEAGLKDGFIIMSCLSFLLCYAYIKVYDIIKKDLFLLEDGKEWMESKANYAGESKIKLFIAKVIRKGGFISAFLILSFWKDPFYTLAFCRKGKYNGFSLRDWGIFLGSVAIGNAVWALPIFGGIELFKFLWK